MPKVESPALGGLTERATIVDVDALEPIGAAIGNLEEDTLLVSSLLCFFATGCEV
jgi:hypothetical protein